jgi:hypothetical protein
MGKITFGSQWDIDNLVKIGVTIPKKYTIADPNMPTPKPVSTCDTAYFAALRAKHAAASKCTRYVPSCAERYALLRKVYPNMSESKARSLYMTPQYRNLYKNYDESVYLNPSLARTSSASSLISAGYNPCASSGGSCGSSSTKTSGSSCRSCKSKKQNYNKQTPKTSKKRRSTKRKCKARRNK